MCSNYFKELSFFIYSPISPKICLVSPDMCEDQNFEKKKLGLQIRNLEVQMGVTFEFED